jgi:hypothetical protein
LQHAPVVRLFFDRVRKEKVRFSRNQRLAGDLFDVENHIATFQRIHHFDAHFAVSIIGKTPRWRRFHQHLHFRISLLQSHTLYGR